MALVAYDDSDISDSDEDQFVTTKSCSENEPSKLRILTPCKSLHDSLPKPKVEIDNNFDHDNTISSPLDKSKIENDSTQNSIFKTLPKPSYKFMVNEEDDEFLHKKETAPPPEEVKKPKTVKISIPSLSEFKDLDEPYRKTMKAPATKQSGLLGMLPEPKFCGSTKTSTSKGLIPDVLRMKPQSVLKASVPKKLPTKPTITIIPQNVLPFNKVRSLISHDSDESDNEYEDKSMDFFSLNKEEEVLPTPVDIYYDLDIKMPSVSQPTMTRLMEKPPLQMEALETQDNMHEMQPQKSYEKEFSQLQPSSSSGNETELNEEALRQLCGARRKHKKETIQIIDVDQQVVLADAKEWVQKSLTEDTSKRMSCSKRRGDEPTNQQKKKHQITYLAHQAKANEVELQNQWANNRLSKRQTQSKYGF